jgi:hypothetical protein
MATVTSATPRPGVVICISQTIGGGTSISSGTATTASLSYTPLSAANLVRFSFDCLIQTKSNGGDGQLLAFRGSTQISNMIQEGYIASGQGSAGGHMVAYDQPNSTSAQSYIAQAKCNVSGLVSFTAGNLVCEEIMG